MKTADLDRKIEDRKMRRGALKAAARRAIISAVLDSHLHPMERKMLAPFIPITKLKPDERGLRVVVFVRPSQIERLMPKYVRPSPVGTPHHPLPIQDNPAGGGEFGDELQWCDCNDPEASVRTVHVKLERDTELYQIDPRLARNLVGESLTGPMLFGEGAPTEPS